MIQSIVQRSFILWTPLTSGSLEEMHRLLQPLYGVVVVLLVIGHLCKHFGYYHSLVGKLPAISACLNWRPNVKFLISGVFGFLGASIRPPCSVVFWLIKFVDYFILFNLKQHVHGMEDRCCIKALLTQNNVFLAFFIEHKQT